MPQPVTILFYNEFWPSLPQSLPECPWPCRLLFDSALLPEADVVVFHIPTLCEPVDVEERPGQLWVAWSMESEINYPCLADAAFMQQFDLTMTYRRDADIWVPYFGPGTPAQIQAPPQAKTEPALAVYLASNPHDRSGRDRYVAELMRHLPVDSYGRCLRNRTLPHDKGRRSKLETIARYKFTLAFENSIARDYVTEKFFDPLIAGSVPVYLGAPNVDELAPGDRAFIDVTHFGAPVHLAEYLRDLAADEQRYGGFLAWKLRPLRERFVRLAESVAMHPICRLAALAARRRQAG
ncbi:MAG TPA: glycosyltransferase family 10 [Anaerolineae bacterium]|nr:glycosyltransferase family 10 [Anaerolineae bacterium]HOQ97722.1 glycosyltransferase family 10 [Anaerolineae bacterium]HPL29847.1 glycosyltransferase family 10 [Anaerolineae bacterium]